MTSVSNKLSIEIQIRLQDANRVEANSEELSGNVSEQ